jgi:hypothetical protein
MRLVKLACILVLSIVFSTAFSCGSNSKESESNIPAGGQIIADHTVVDRYDDIPQTYIDIVKTWLVDAAGESHSAAYRDGMVLLEDLDPTFQAQTFTSGFPIAGVPAALRLGSHISVGEGQFWTNTAAINNIKTRITNQHDSNNPINVIFQAWCWDFTRTTGAAGTGTNGIDPVYGCHWYGSSEGGTEGDHIWGLDSGDYTITGNSLSLQSYLDVVDDYRHFCETNSYVCVPVFTTGPVDDQSYDGEQGYQRFVKHEYIRDYVKSNPERVLFDYADILCYNNSGQRNGLTWTDTNSVIHTFQGIHSDNLRDLNGDPDTSVGHIGATGSVRLAKAMWWMLARMAGWDGQ